MHRYGRHPRCALLVALAAATWGFSAQAADKTSDKTADPAGPSAQAKADSKAATPQQAQAKAKAKAKQDLSGQRRVGKASRYAHKFAGRKMADGTPMNPHDDNAASKTLPLGTVAKVTNVETGKSAVVTIQDRGPYVPGRIVDLSPATAEKIGLGTKEGVADVAVEPIVVPLPDGGVKPGVAADEHPSLVHQAEQNRD